MKAGWMAILKDSHNVAVFDSSQIMARQFMEYVLAQANQKTRKPLSKAGYGSKLSAFFHLIRVHNGMGPNAGFDAKLKTLWKGFTRQTIQQKLRTAPAPRNPMATRPSEQADDESESNVNVNVDEEDGDSDIEAEEDDNHDEFKQGKKPMSPELFHKVFSWLMALGTFDAMFTAVFSGAYMESCLPRPQYRKDPAQPYVMEYFRCHPDQLRAYKNGHSLAVASNKKEYLLESLRM
jgi:hypothetical protein